MSSNMTAHTDPGDSCGLVIRFYFEKKKNSLKLTRQNAKIRRI